MIPPDQERERPWLDYVKVVFVISPLVTTLFVLAFQGLDHLGRRIGISVSIAMVTATVCFWGTHLVTAIEERIRQSRSLRPAEHGRLWYYALATLIMPLGLYTGFLTVVAVGPLFSVRFEMPDLSDYRSGIFLGMTAAGLFFLYETRNEMTRNLAREENARLDAQLRALTARLNPHFLFNSLNTVASLIPEQPDAAEDLTVELAELYRSVLSATKKASHPLEEELAIVRHYLEIEQRRFGSRLRFELSVEADRTLEVPALILQPLVENAIKHGIARRAEGGTVVVRARTEGDALLLTVEDDGPGPDVEPADGTRSGLETCRSRLRLLYGDAGRLSLKGRGTGGACASLRFPVRQEAS